MKGKVVLLTGVAIGYVLGTRAGRGQYEKLRSQAKTVWNDPKVQTQVSHAATAVKEQAPVVQDMMVDLTRKAASKVSPSGPEGETKGSRT